MDIDLSVYLQRILEQYNMDRYKQSKNQVSIENIQESVQPDYMDGDILIIGNIRDIPDKLFVDNSLGVILFVICTHGKLQVRIKSKTVVVHSHEVLCCGPNTIIDDCMMSPDFEARILCLSPRMIQNILHDDKKIWNHYFYIGQNPVLNIGEESLRLFEQYYQLLEYRMKFSSRSYNKKTMVSLISALLYDLLADLSSPSFEKTEEDTLISQRDIIFKRFIELLSKSEPKKRSLSFYAEQLCITPKHLSTTIKRVSGKTAFEWINEYVIEDVKQQLSFSSKSIKEIADFLNFPNISFFGKYVRTHLGVSPTEFRRQIHERL